MKILQNVNFGNDTADDISKEELLNYFVEQDTFRSFLDPVNKIKLFTAKKGVGKSALLQWTHYKLGQTDPNSIVIKCRGADLVRNKFNLTSTLKSPNDYINDWMVRICTTVNRELASYLNIALTDDSISLIESAEISGYKSRNLISCLLDRFKSFFDKAQPTKIDHPNNIELLKRVKNCRVWILVDDLDATFQNTPNELLELSTFFTACRYLTQDLTDICFRITMRADVWPIIRRYDESLNKIDQYVEKITWTQRDFRKLLYLRIKSEVDRLQMPSPELQPKANEEKMMESFINLLFLPGMEWGSEDRYTYRVIYTLSYARPRWAIQLCKLSQKYAIKCHDDKISKKHIDHVWGDYGRNRIDDLVSEHKHQCKEIQEIINSFRECKRKLTRDELLTWLNNHISTHLQVNIEGNNTRSSRDIAQFLYRIGFIIARSESNEINENKNLFLDDESTEYEHYHFDEMPDFLTSRTNHDFGVLWEIHPCYREALDIVKLNKYQRDKRRNS